MFISKHAFHVSTVYNVITGYLRVSRITIATSITLTPNRIILSTLNGRSCSRDLNYVQIIAPRFTNIVTAAYVTSKRRRSSIFVENYGELLHIFVERFG